MTLVLIIIFTNCSKNLLLSYLESLLPKPIELEVGDMYIAFSFTEENFLFFLITNNSAEPLSHLFYTNLVAS
jgi:hypothetical protein